jgi:hypothetical protein
MQQQGFGVTYLSGEKGPAASVVKCDAGSVTGSASIVQGQDAHLPGEKWWFESIWPLMH